MLIPLFTVNRDDRKSGHNQWWSLTFRFNWGRMLAFLLYRKDKAFYHWISSACAQNSSYKTPSTKRNTQILCWNIKIFSISGGKNDLCPFQCNLISILCVSDFLAQLGKISFFFFKFIKYLWGADPKVHRFGDECFIPFLKNSNRKYLKMYKRQHLGKKSSTYSLSQ